MKRKNSKKTSWRFFSDPVLVHAAAWIAVWCIYVGLRFNSISIPLERDEGLFGYIGQVIRDGGLPYRDAIDHKPPGVYYIYAAALLLFPPTPAGVHLFLLIYNALTFMALYGVVRLARGSSSAGLLTALCYAVLSSSPQVEGFAASTEMILLLPLALSLAGALLAIRWSSVVMAFASGVLAAAVVWIKHTGIFLALTVLCLQLAAQQSADFQRSRQMRSSAGYAAAWLAGFFALSLGVVGYFYIRGGGDDFLYWNFIFNYYYGTGQDIVSSLPKLSASLRALCTAHPVIVGAALGCVVFGVAVRDVRGLCLLLFLVASLAAVVPGYAYPHYFAQLTPALALGAGFGLERFTNAVASARLRQGLIALCCCGVCGVPVWQDVGYYVRSSSDELSKRFFSPNPFPETIEAATYIAHNSTQRDKVFIFGSEAQILFYSRRKSASRFVLLYPLTRTIYPQHRLHQQQAWDEITQSRPTYVVVVNVFQSVLWDGKADLWLYRQLMDFVAQRYELVAAVPVAYPRGRLITHPDSNKIAKEIADYKYTIKIFRRRYDA